MRLMRLSTYAKQRYPLGDGPTLRTLRNRCESGLIPGATKEGGLWFINIDVHEKASSSLVSKVLSESKYYGRPS
ncbi:hypothetical protein [Zooshikella ganghwensis]|uniref:DNA-binding protein n=1 Tax=Zooshikella ganghwensis TaxID=202772 RepID=A0A4P9VRA6_9GAMM|nr:hypothetical protein [Zooshikella ganghwensis]RDH44652.1 hypothetical protein B9G39_15085 [Zooshikella ganghwensis]